MLRKSVRPLHTIYTLFLIEKDQLTANFARFGSGFILDNQLKIAREQLDTMKELLEEVESRKGESLKFDCYTGHCYKK